MAKLNPPIVKETIEAQIVNNDMIKIPFLMSQSVGMSDFISLVLILRSVQSNTILNSSGIYCLKNSLYYSNGMYYATFDIPVTVHLNVGQYYKAQIAYVSNENIIGHYSTNIVFKVSAQPNVTIEGLNPSAYNVHTYTYTGVYQNNMDPGEKVYSYDFKLYKDAELIAESGDQLHDSSKDTGPSSSTDQWTIKIGLQPNQKYNLFYTVKTTNGLICSSVGYSIIDNQTVTSQVFKYYDFNATPIPDSACVELSIDPKKNLINQDRKLINGKFILLRASSEDNFESWKELTRFILSSWGSDSRKYICRDYSVQQGVRYKYAIQAYNDNGLFSKRQESHEFLMDFEDLFLSDGKRQLRIKFNPKVPSMKNTILESKIDTLGGKYPFFFRNGNVNYKEFSISGLISTLMDENGEFINGISFTEPKRNTTPALYYPERQLSTMLTGENFKSERDFKHEVLNWLTNGEPKLFRSPGEGNFLVRLMNTSLSPNDTLSRMLHSFSCTAYEIDDLTFDTLRQYGMLMDDYTETRDVSVHQVQLNSQASWSNLNACMATVSGRPGTVFCYELFGDSKTYSCAIGNTGVYEFDSEVLRETPLVRLWNENGTGHFGWGDAILTYATFVTHEFNSFSHIESIDINEVGAQWIGNSIGIDVLKPCFDIRKDIGMIYQLQVRKRFIQQVDEAIEQPNETYIFRKDGVPYAAISNIDIITTGNNDFYDGRTSRKMTSVDTRFKYNNEIIDMEGINTASVITDGRIIYNNISDLDHLYLGNGVYVDILYQEIIKTYSLEATNSTVIFYKNKWMANPTENNYKDYCQALENALNDTMGGQIIDAL